MNTYIIAEIGQNHNGDIEIAKKLIDVASIPVFDFFSGVMLPGVNAVKLTRRDLSEEFTDESANLPYVSPHSFGQTYLEHRKALELTLEQHQELEKYAHAKGLEFIETLCSPKTLDILDVSRIDRVKIASRDITNVPLLNALAEIPHPLILSTGMCSEKELREALRILRARKPGREISLLHCISQYPAEYHNINLLSVPYLKKTFPECPIGYSDHSIGIMVPVVAVALGATIIEKHITLNRNMKGADHAGSLEAEGLWRMVRDIRNVELALGEEKKEYNAAVDDNRRRLGRSLALAVPLKQGETLKETYLCMRSPGNGLAWVEREKLIGKKAVRDIPANSLIHLSDFQVE